MTDHVKLDAAVQRIERRHDLARRQLVLEQGELVDQTRQLLDSLLDIRDSEAGTEAERADVARACADAAAALDRHLEKYNQLRNGA